jgi:hypothetical protein
MKEVNPIAMYILIGIGLALTVAIVVILNFALLA